MTDKQFAKAIGRRNFHGLRGGGQEGQVSQGKKQVHEDVFSPYEISALRSLAADRRFNETDPKDPPWSYPEAPAQNADIEFADGISGSDLPSKHHCGRNDNFEDYCQWCNKQFQKNAKLWEVSKFGDFEGVETAVSNGAEVNSTDPNYCDWTAMHYASFYGNSEVVERLTDFGANTSPVDENGWTPLHYAAFKGHTDTCLALLECGANAWAQNHYNKTALQKAVYLHHVETIELLCEWMGIPSASFIAGTPVDLEQIKEEMNAREEEEEIMKMEGKNVTEDAAAQEERRIEEENNIMELQAEYDRRYRSLRHTL